MRYGQRTARKELVALVSHAAFCLALFLPAITTVAHDANAPFDLVIVHGRIIDGTGSPWYSADVGIRNGRIAAIGNLEREARAKTVDAHDHVVAPHRHAGPVRTEHSGRASAAVEDISGRYHRNNGRGEFGGTAR